MKKGFVPIIVMVIVMVALAALGGAGFVVVKVVKKNAAAPAVSVSPMLQITPSPQSSPAPQISTIPQYSPSSIDILEWKTYRNEEYGFSLKYPAHYSDFERTESMWHKSDIYDTEYQIAYRSKTIATWSILSKPTTDIYPEFIISIFPLDAYRFSDVSAGVEYGYDSEKNEWWQNWGGSRKPIQLEKTQGKGWIGYRVEGGAVHITAIPVGSKNIMVEVWFAWDEVTLEEPPISSILSTLRFSGPADALDWKTYRNEKYGFSFRYPQVWLISESYDCSKVTLAFGGSDTIIDFFISSGAGGLDLECPFSTHEIECAVNTSVFGVRYVRRIGTGQLQYNAQKQLDAYFDSKNASIRATAILTDVSGISLSLTDTVVKTFDQIMQSLDIFEDVNPNAVCMPPGDFQPQPGD